MGDNLKGRVSQLGERLKIGGSEVGQKLSARMSSLSFKMKEFIQGGNHSDSLVEEAMEGPDWATNLEICDLINHGRVNSVELIRGVKKRMVMSRSPRVQYLSLVLLETLDELTITLLQQCRESKNTVQRIIETPGNNEALLFEALNVNDEIQNVISDMKKPLVVSQEPEHTMGHADVELRIHFV